jgi:hypothetical protein
MRRFPDFPKGISVKFSQTAARSSGRFCAAGKKFEM